MSGYPGGYPQQPAANPYQGAPQAGYGAPGAMPGQYQQPGAMPGQYQQPGAMPGQYQQPGAPQYGAPQAYQQQHAPQHAPQHAAPQGYPQQGGVSQEVMSWFRAVDQDNSGFINAQELSRALQSGNNRNFSVQACSTMMGMFDHQRTGRIDMNQFAQLFAFINQWTEAFRRADSDRTGTISCQEMMPVLQQQGYVVSPSTIQQMVQKFGQPNSTGPYQQPGGAATLGLDGFILVNVQLRRLTDAFRQRDVQQKGQITVGYEDFINMVINTV